MICPWYRTSCPGEDKCMPAVLLAKRLPQLSDETAEGSAPRCPIELSISAFAVASTAIWAYCDAASAAMCQDRLATKPAAADRTHVLSKLQIDQEPPC
jgi:hypothetical protein